jgi:inositol-phosphate phosphatase/L-galactose 1-phosphate phosphatase/histidinol-phosphatase
MPLLSHDLVSFIHQLAQLSGEVIRRYYRHPTLYDQSDIKTDQSPVTIADREAEQVMRNAIKQHYPDHGIWGEEAGSEKMDAPYIWVLDPIDGTKSFLMGRPIFVTLIALLHHGNPILGAISQPITDELWIGGDDIEASLNQKPIRASSMTSLKKTKLATTDRALLSKHGQQILAHIEPEIAFVNCGGDGYNYALLANGYVDVVFEEGLKLHDFAAIAPLINAAGGVCTDWAGNPLSIHSDGTILASANPTLHQRLLATISLHTL